MKNEYITREHILEVEELEKYIDTFIILNRLNSNFMIDVYDKNTKIGNCELKYNLDLRKFEYRKNKMQENRKAIVLDMDKTLINEVNKTDYDIKTKFR